MDKEKAKKELCGLVGLSSFEGISLKQFMVLLNGLSGADYKRAKELICFIWFE